MQVKQCSECGRPADPPFTIVRFELPASLVGETDASTKLVERELVVCRDCNARVPEERAAAQEHIDGHVWQCVLCRDDLDQPGGYAVPTFDGRGVLRLCGHCRDDFARHGHPLA
jgi:hypothetical protein